MRVYRCLSLLRYLSVGWHPSRLSYRSQDRDRPQPALGRRWGFSASIRTVAVFFAILAIPSTPSLAQSALPPAQYAYRQLPDAAQEAEARGLMETLRCLVCQGQSIADSDADMAGDMRNLVRQKIAAGEEPEAVRDWLIERYGSWVSYDPPVGPATWPLWLAPIVLLTVGGFVAARKLGRRTDRKDTE